MKRWIIKKIKSITEKSLKRYFGGWEIKNIVRGQYPEIVLMPDNLTFADDGLFTIHNSGFMKDPLFLESYQLGKATGSWGESDIQWRAYIACWAADKAKKLEGDFIECGVNKGGLSRMIINYIDFKSTGKKFYLLDTFNGLVENYISEEEKKTWDTCRWLR